MTETTQKAQIGVTGLATMGRNLARNIARHGYVTAVHNRSDAKTRALVEEFGEEGTFVPSYSSQDFVDSLESPRTIIIMVKAGDPTDAVIDELAPLLSEGDILVDAGNAHFADTRRREAALRERGIHFAGVGVSGGEEGALLGPSIMPGGSEHAYAKLGPIFADIAVSVDGDPVLHPRRPRRRRPLREDGPQRHRVRRHAAHRRGLRPAAPRPGPHPEAARAGVHVLERGRPGELPHRDHRPGAREGRPHDQAGGPGRRWSTSSSTRPSRRAPAAGRCRPPWTSGLPSPASPRPSSPARCPVTPSSATPPRASCPAPTPTQPAEEGSGKLRFIAEADAEQFVDDVRAALYASKVVAYAQGFDMIRAGSVEYGWGVDPGAMATIWRGGCIIRAKFLDRIKDAYANQPDLPRCCWTPTSPTR